MGVGRRGRGSEVRVDRVVLFGEREASLEARIDVYERAELLKNLIERARTFEELVKLLYDHGFRLVKVPGIMIAYGCRAIADLYFWILNNGKDVASIRITLRGTQYDLAPYWEFYK